MPKLDEIAIHANQEGCLHIADQVASHLGRFQSECEKITLSLDETNVKEATRLAELGILFEKGKIKTVNYYRLQDWLGTREIAMTYSKCRRDFLNSL